MILALQFRLYDACAFPSLSLSNSLSLLCSLCVSVKVEFTAGTLNVRGGGLSTIYDTLQFHLHWGDQSSTPGSEHTVDGKRYPMEVTIPLKDLFTLQ